MVLEMRSFVRGPLEPYVSGFADELARLGYTRCSLEQHVCFIAHLDRWLAAERLGVVGHMSAAVVDRYLAERRAAGYVNYRSMKAVRPLLRYLDRLGMLPVADVAVGPVPALLERYRAYFVRERGLTAGTALLPRRDPAVRDRSAARRPRGPGRVDGRGRDRVVLAACPGRAPGTAKLVVTALRSLLTFLHVEGVIGTPLAAAVPAVAGWRLAGLPRALEAEQLRRLLASCDRRRRRGRRDYAVLLFLSRLGLRAGEVAGLGLDDLDWRAGELVVRGKANGPNDCRCPMTSARQSSLTCDTAVR